MIFVPETLDECIGLALREWRLREGLTMEEAATRCGASQASWSRWEAGMASVTVRQCIEGELPLASVIGRALELRQAHLAAGGG
jgi:transcriptional regulator with XRE-family HTH domain